MARAVARYKMRPLPDALAMCEAHPKFKERTKDTPPELRDQAYDYELDHPITHRVRRDYEGLGLAIRH